MGFADLHIHSIHSYDGTGSVSAILKHVADHTDLDVIAITDHDTMSGVREAMELAPSYGVEVIPGAEISTADGHLLALFIDRPIQAGLSLLQTLRMVADQGGLCIAAHPMAKYTSSLDFFTIQQALNQPGIDRVLVGVEAINGGLVFTRRNPLIETFARALPLAQVGNSDAHVLLTIGRVSTEFVGSTARELRAALINHSTRIRSGKGLGGLDVIRTYLPRYLLRKLGWVVYNAEPGAPLKLARLNRAMNYHSAISVQSV
jgi:hypothetical protein